MKKAISPLTSTIAMLMFAVFLGVIVMSWGVNKEVKEDRECDKTSVGVISFKGMPQACYTETNINFIIENNGKSAIDGFRAFVIGDNIFKDDIQLMLAVGDIARKTFPYENIDSPKALRLVPKIEEKGFSTLCASNSLTVDLAPCASIGVE